MSRDKQLRDILTFVSYIEANKPNDPDNTGVIEACVELVKVLFGESK